MNCAAPLLLPRLDRGTSRMIKAKDGFLAGAQNDKDELLPILVVLRFVKNLSLLITESNWLQSNLG